MRRRPVAALSAPLLVCAVLLGAGCGASAPTADDGPTTTDDRPAAPAAGSFVTTIEAPEDAVEVPPAETVTTPEVESVPPPTMEWVSVEDCETVEAILRWIGQKDSGGEDSARSLVDNLGSGSKIRVSDRKYRTVAWLGGGIEGTGTCDFRR